MNVTEKITKLIASLWREVLTFGAVGGLGWFLHNGIYSLLWHGPMSESTIKARVVSTVTATLFAWFASRYWTFRHRRTERVWKEFTLFLIMNGLGLGIVLACQVTSRYGLGLTSFTADFIAGGAIGLILGTIFRFLAYRYFVFTKELASVVGESSTQEGTARNLGVAPNTGAAGHAALRSSDALAHRIESPDPGNQILVSASSSS